MTPDEDTSRGVVVLRVGDLVDNAQRAVRWVGRTGWGLGQRLPGAGLVDRELRRVRRQVRRLGKGAMDELARGVAAINRELAARGGPAANGRPGGLRAGMAELLGRALESDAAESKQYLYQGMLRRLVPDEARILAALSDGTVYPVLDVAVRAAFGQQKELVLRNASTVGRAAGVALVEDAHVYLGRLLELGLAERGPARDSLETEYEVLRADPVVRAAEERARELGNRAPRLIRGSVQLSPLGKDFWAACAPEG
ncbi:uncharacterized protein DUF4393 [Tamaricihabitans halophyticus]|uniref:Uncharacterized protein DUF4393 n=1 Tax=Tamaricihabitans halophyticus TaxID=1262583 RepID=A0A4R2QXK4_9PSEU|nr:Abi-alpha family protein [Tamaricihabitans halophyticus]TCP51885.1 uncharacterized protein DUF4393 [Tamaricihabitans halophyticus]